MGLLIDYFVAPSDSDAQQVVDVGPAGRFPTTDGSGIEPTVNLGQFEELLTGKTFDQQLDDPESYKMIASANDHHNLVIRLEPGFVAALAHADSETLGRLSEPWSHIEEFAGMAPPSGLEDFLSRLRELCIQASDTSGGLYCWVCV
jgi:hypothetical protein